MPVEHGGCEGAKHGPERPHEGSVFGVAGFWGDNVASPCIAMAPVAPKGSQWFQLSSMSGPRHQCGCVAYVTMKTFWSTAAARHPKCLHFHCGPAGDDGTQLWSCSQGPLPRSGDG
jgi:hypothetical protein